MNSWPAILDSILQDSGLEQERLRLPDTRPAPDAPQTRGVHPEGLPAGDYILYWMQKAQRSEDNPALEFAVAAADRLRLPLLVLFVLTDYPSANPNHYRFMLSGLGECAAALRARGIGFRLVGGKDPVAEVAGTAMDAAILVCDEGRLDFERRWRLELAGRFRHMVMVETEAVVPPDTVSTRAEYSAATIRPRISANLPRFLAGAFPGIQSEARVPRRSFPMDAQGSEDSLFSAWSERIVPAYPGDRVAEQRFAIRPGQAAGMTGFRAFVESGRLERYDADRNDPTLDGQSGLSPYLHFGQLSPVRLAREALRHPGPSSQAFVEQLVVRRELAVNFTLRNPGYSRYDTAVPSWAREALDAVRNRPDTYEESVLEAGATEDRFWNAAQNEMVLTGKMHNYMRMYWGKRILSWRRDPAEAFRIALRLNDRYSLDGRDPNGYAGVAWCFGRHDRPWPLQPLFGAVRAMVPGGLRRKFDASAYAAGIESMYIRRHREE